MCAYLSREQHVLRLEVGVNHAACAREKVERDADVSHDLANHARRDALVSVGFYERQQVIAQHVEDHANVCRASENEVDAVYYVKMTSLRFCEYGTLRMRRPICSAPHACRAVLRARSGQRAPQCACQASPLGSALREQRAAPHAPPPLLRRRRP